MKRCCLKFLFCTTETTLSSTFSSSTTFSEIMSTIANLDLLAADRLYLFAAIVCTILLRIVLISLCTSSMST